MLNNKNKNKNKRESKIYLVVYLAIAIFLIAGCSKSSKQKNLEFYHYDIANEDMYEELAREYSKDNKYNIKVKLVPRKSYLSSLKSGKNLPDVFLTSEKDLAELLEDKKTSKKFANLKKFTKKEKIEDDFFSQLGRKKGWIREKTLALPYKYDIPIIIYNKELFQLYNLKEPENIEEFIEICSSLDENDIIPIGMKVREDILNIGDLAQGILLNSDDGSDLITEEGELSSGFEDLFELSSKFQGRILFKSDPPNSNEELLQGFAEEEYAMFSGILEDMAYLDSEDINYGYFTMPGYLGNSRGTIKASSMIGISKKAKSTKEAKNFVLFLLEDENQNKLGVRADGFTIYPRQYNGNTSPEEINSFTEELNLVPNLFQTRLLEEKQIYLKEIDAMFSNEFKDIDELNEELKKQLE